MQLKSYCINYYDYNYGQNFNIWSQKETSLGENTSYQHAVNHVHDSR